MSTVHSTVQRDPSLADQILSQVEEIVLESEQNQKPLEVDPFRSRLFELFVTAEGAGYLAEDSIPDLTADGLCRALATKWGLRTAAESSLREQSRIPTEHLARMRSMWSVMRMWMEWTYAWQRYDEFHPRGGGR
jgi:hypothetical protein